MQIRKTNPVFPLKIFENVAYIMALHGDKTTPKTIEEWLDSFVMFSIYEVLPEIVTLWGENIETEVTQKRITRNEREMTTPLLPLRALEIGLSLRDLDLISIGLLIDMWTEKADDSASYRRMSTQKDFGRF